MDFFPANAAHWHLVMNHLPVVGSLAALLLLGWALIKNTDDLKRTALGAMVLVALTAIPVFLTGDPAERYIKGLAGVSSRWVSSHEEMGEYAMWAAIIVGALALGALVFFRKSRPIPRWVVVLILALDLAVCGLMACTANYGGKIHHPEIRAIAPPETSPADADR